MGKRAVFKVFFRSVYLGKYEKLNTVDVVSSRGFHMSKGLSKVVLFYFVSTVSTNDLWKSN